MIKLLATADIHLGRRSSHAGDDHASPRHAWTDFVNHAVAGQYDIVLLTGDIVDQDNRYFEGSSILEAGLKMLDDRGIHVFVVSGNHDFDVLPGIMKRFRFSHVHLLGAGGRWERQRLTIRQIKVSVTGWSFPQRHYRVDPLSDLYHQLDQLDDSDIRIGMVHGDLEDAKSAYAPLSLERLTTSGHHAWFLGHVHKPATHRNAARIPVYYPGSLQALSPKETGPHGALHVEFSAGRVTREDQIIQSRTRYETLELNLTEEKFQHADEIRQEVDIRMQEYQEERRKEHERLQTLVIDLQVTVRADIRESLQNKLNELTENQTLLYGGVNLRVRSLRCSGQLPPADLDVLMEQSSPAGMLARMLKALESDTPTEQTRNLEERIRQQIRVIPGKVFQAVKDNRQATGRPLEAEVRNIALRQCREALNRLLAQKNA
jgi:DNA repair exonuclease SbcCD nuclease subunit